MTARKPADLESDVESASEAKPADLESDVESASEAKPEALVVLVPFAYATTLKNEVRQLVKGTAVDPADYTEASIAHLQGIGFIGVES